MEKTIEIPKLDELDFAMGTTKHLPRYEDCKADEAFEEIAQNLFFKGAKGCPEELKPKNGVNWKKALVFIFAHLRSFEPSHEHKIAGCAQLLSKYFDLKEAK